MAATNGAAPVALAVLAVIAVVAALYLARAFFVPLLIGILASYSLRPVVEWLAAWHIPRALGAGLVLAAVVGGSSWAVFSLGDDAAAVIETLPAAARRMRGHVSVARAGGPSALNKIQEAATELEGAATDAAGDGKPVKPKRPGIAARDAEPSAWL
ncbi:MAG: AI-2E family transporter, partial [Lysobacter sp.]|nr:AI-2E family transporter [Lysobacter sp.]